MRELLHNLELQILVVVVAAQELLVLHIQHKHLAQAVQA
jgi:hypothetical protein